LLPVLNLAIKGTRAFADVAYALSGLLQRLGNAFDPLVDLFPRVTGMLSPLMGQITKFIDETAVAIKPLINSAAELAATGIAPLISEMTQQFIILATVMKPQIELMARLTKVHLDALTFFSRFSAFSLLGGGGSMARAGTGGNITNRSMGAAVANVGIGGVEDYEKKAWMMAFRLGSGAGADPADKTADATTRTAGGIQELLNMLSGWAKYMEALPTLSEIITFIQSLPQELADKLWQVIKGVIPGAGELTKAAGEGLAGARDWATSQGQRIQARAEATRNALVSGAEELGIPVPAYMKPRR
jgi:hypothetical protein